MEQEFHNTTADLLHEKALTAWASDNPTEAIALLKQAIELAPNVATYHANLGVMLKGIGTPADRIACYRRAVQLEPGNATYFSNLVAALNAAGLFTEAEAVARHALALNDKRQETWHNLASALGGQGKWTEAAATYEQALALNANAARTLVSTAGAHRKANQFPQAIARFTQALGLPELQHDQRIACLHGIAGSLAALNRNHEAAIHLREVLAIAPDNLQALIDLGNLEKRLSNFDEARRCYQSALGVDPNCVEAVFNLGAVEQACGRHSEALRLYDKAIQMDASLPAVWNNLTACMTYATHVQPQEIRRKLTVFDSTIAWPLREKAPFQRTRDPHRVLKVGYVSADFRAHPVGYLAWPVIEGHRRDQVHVTCYFSHRQSDEWTTRLKQAADEWVDVADLDDAALADRIRKDGIDILVDLAGHTEGNRLLAFARKPAPVQITWMGYVTTTGMSTMDWRITHADADPPGSEDAYSERLWRLAGAMWCFRPLQGMPDVSLPPFVKRGHITFGSFNRFSKNSSKALAAWAEILRQVPDSRLLLCATPNEIAGSLERYFAERGVASDRVTTFASVGHEKFWALHAEVDIALDPFPFNGGMTSCETLWLGVPLVTCTGVDGEETESTFPARFSSRMGYAFVNGIGLPELAARTIPEYIELASSLARSPMKILELRATLRGRMSASPLMDKERFVCELETAYRAMWRDFCDRAAESDV
ncbi:glycosyltransferase family 41 protein [Noviherbaspirillum sp.]|uniref:tetratricopeptide repeat protein n=1 Tax=Noviherbaspirillum sp. TaxID=1926288 RepID=UPI0025F33DE6|nr:glycosyltransferase family 41 protein [Noviherbaspirillum sp.]